MGRRSACRLPGGRLVALIVAGSSEKRGVQWRRDLPRPESKEMGMTLDVRL
jgi:hypothetical protein